MAHPYEMYEQTPLWNALDREIATLEANNDVVLTTPREYVLGALCKRLITDAVVPMAPATTRAAFAAFLDSVADGRSDVAEWSAFAATHYADPVLERARSNAVRMVFALPVGAVLAPEATERLRRWAAELRQAGV
jgi:hypothetical protein